MLQFDHLEDAIDKVSSLKQFCFGVRIVSDDDDSVLFSSLPETGEATTSPTQSAQKKRTSGVAQVGLTGKHGSSRKLAAQEVSRLQILIGDQSCTLEMIQPYRRVISAVTGTSAQAFDGQEYLSHTIGNMLLKDTLTGLYNRRYIDEYLPGAISTACDCGQPLSLIFADIDEFKLVNDHHGHITGDLVIQHIAELFQKNIRQMDSWVARYGGDEFIICLPGVDHAAATRIANRVRLAVMNERFRLENDSISLTCSFGVHTVDQSEFQLSALKLLHRADEKLYQAKRAGRNKVF